MSLRRWLSEGRLKPHRASARETTDLLRVGEAELAELLLEAQALQTAVLDWLRREKPDLLSEEP